MFDMLRRVRLVCMACVSESILHLELETEGYLIALVVHVVLDVELGLAAERRLIEATHLARLDNHDVLLGTVARGLGDVLDDADNVHAFEDVSEHDVAVVQPRGLDGADEELRAVGVAAGVGHGWSQQGRHEDAQRTPGPVCLSLKFSSGKRSP